MTCRATPVRLLLAMSAWNMKGFDPDSESSVVSQVHKAGGHHEAVCG